MANLVIEKRWKNGDVYAGVKITMPYEIDNSSPTTAVLKCHMENAVLNLTEGGATTTAKKQILEQLKNTRKLDMQRGSVVFSANCQDANGNNKELGSYTLKTATNGIKVGNTTLTYTYTKNHTAYNKGVWVRLSGVSHVSASVTINAKTSYQVKLMDGSTTVLTSTKWYGENLAISKSLSKADYNFLGWNSAQNATSAAYSSSFIYTLNEAKTLYAVWQSKYKIPTLMVKSVSRCTQDGTDSEEGTWAKATLIWSIYHNDANNNQATITVECNEQTTTFTSPSGTYSVTANNPTILKVNSSLSPDNKYPVTITLVDKMTGNTNKILKTITIPSVKYIIDVCHKDGEGEGIAFGGAASSANTMDVYYKGIFNNGIQDPTGFDSRYKSVEVTNLNNAINPYTNYWAASNATNRPPRQMYYLVRAINTTNLDGQTSDGHCVQLASGYGGISSSLWVRNRNNNTSEWGVWYPLSKTIWRSVAETHSTGAGNVTITLTTPFPLRDNYSRSLTGFSTNSSNVIVAGGYIDGGSTVKLRVHNFSSTTLNVVYGVLYMYLDDYSNVAQFTS